MYIHWIHTSVRSLILFLCNHSRFATHGSFWESWWAKIFVIYYKTPMSFILVCQSFRKLSWFYNRSFSSCNNLAHSFCGETERDKKEMAALLQLVFIIDSILYSYTCIISHIIKKTNVAWRSWQQESWKFKQFKYKQV